jgi:SAM-dependent methyltransferase
MIKHPAENILSLYQNHASAFAEQRSRSLFEKRWLDAFSRYLPPAGRILDMGCGNGQPLAGYFLHQSFLVTGVDGASAMIERASTAFPTSRWIHQDMRQLALQETFDGVMAWDSFFHLTQDDQRAMFPVFAAHSHAGSALMFTSGTHDGIAMGEFEGEPLFHASLDPDEYHALLAHYDFSVEEVVFNDPQCGGHSVWLCRKQA